MSVGSAGKKLNVVGKKVQAKLAAGKAAGQATNPTQKRVKPPMAGKTIRKKK